MSDALAALIRALAKKAARDHMQENPRSHAYLRDPRAEHMACMPQRRGHKVRGNI